MVMEGKKKKLFSEGSASIKYEKPVLTPSQFFEFQRQALIFEHIKAGLPVPRHVWIPIWKEVAISFGSDRGRIYNLYPSFAGVGPPAKVGPKVDQRNMMDLEPQRCRRTDGNKWRCRKKAVPDKKYCERHMYRGCLRSRKHVETCLIANPLGSNSAQDYQKLEAISVHSQINPYPQSSLPLAFTLHCDSKSPSTSKTRYNVRGSKNSALTIDVSTNTIPTDPISMLTPTAIITNNPTNDSNKGDFESINAAADTNLIPSCNPIVLSIPRCGPSFTTTNTPTITSSINNQNNVSRIIRSSKSGNNIAVIGNNVAAGFGFSPKSVLQGQGCRGSLFYSSYVELKPGRCGRTNGKKWRCSREVVCNQKYCDTHMNRGAKKHMEASQPVSNFIDVTTSTHPPSVETTTCSADSVTSNTNVTSISNPASVAKSPTSSSTDATISDTAHSH